MFRKKFLPSFDRLEKKLSLSGLMRDDLPPPDPEPEPGPWPDDIDPIVRPPIASPLMLGGGVAPDPHDPGVAIDPGVPAPPPPTPWVGPDQPSGNPVV